MVVYTLEQRWEVGRRSSYRRSRFWQKKKVIFSDEAHFDLGGYVNKQNCRIWDTEKPYTMKSRRTQNESLLGADFGPELHTIDNVPKNWTDRVGYYMASGGNHLNEIIFHY